MELEQYTKEKHKKRVKILLKIGLGQIPIDGLERLRDHIKEGEPILLNGGILDSEGCG